ncbi:MAG: FapA family protein [Treponema sp.]|jgi:uncharacterized protein (DUF342 family)|nr:FapA family protein [Treponema sp.]
MNQYAEYQHVKHTTNTIDFIQLQEIMKKQLARDREIRSIETEAPTLEAAISEASNLLNLPVWRVEYEIIEQGFPSLLKVWEKKWKIRAYPKHVITKNIHSLAGIDSQEVETEVEAIKDKDGEVFVQLSVEGVLLKVIPPVGNGKAVTESQALQALQERQITDINTKAVKMAVKEAGSKYVNVGSFDHKFMEDAALSVSISEDEMRAYIVLTPPGPRGSDISFDTMINFLKSNRVTTGIREEFLSHLADRPSYRQQLLAAEGIQPENGKAAYMEYDFQTNQKIRLHEGQGGQVNFKDLNIIQNVIENQPLAKKIPASAGIQGRTVTGKYLESKEGVDIEIPLGKNVHLAKDGLTVLSDMNGQVILTGGKINVEPVYTVQGNVNLKTGNIVFLGTVVVTGSVEDGFSVKASGNIEVNGTVERAKLEAEGDIIVQQGIVGKGGGFIKAGRSLWARFIENCTVEAGNMVIVTDSIMNSQIDATMRIVCQGKRAHIVGGQLRAREEICALNIGSSISTTDTICQVGYDPSVKSQLDSLLYKKAKIEKEVTDIQLNLQSLINIKKQRKKLPEDKEQLLQELAGKRKDIISEIQKLEEEIANIQEILQNLKVTGRVSASNKIYPGVKVTIRDVTQDIRDEYKSVTFTLENGLIRAGKYEEPDESVKKGPDGYE